MFLGQSRKILGAHQNDTQIRIQHAWIYRWSYKGPLRPFSKEQEQQDLDVWLLKMLRRIASKNIIQISSYLLLGWSVFDPSNKMVQPILALESARWASKITEPGHIVLHKQEQYAIEMGDRYHFYRYRYRVHWLYRYRYWYLAQKIKYILQFTVKVMRFISYNITFDL